MGSPLDLVAQLRGDFEAYTRDVYDHNSIDPDIDALRARRQHERRQLDSLHARLHGLRLILAMAQLNAAAGNGDFEAGDTVQLFGEPSADDPSVVLVSLGRPAPPPEPVGVPDKLLEEVVPSSKATAVEEGECCSICIADLEEGETIRKLPGCGHCYHAHCVDRWFKRSVRNQPPQGPFRSASRPLFAAGRCSQRQLTASSLPHAASAPASRSRVLPLSRPLLMLLSFAHCAPPSPSLADPLPQLQARRV